uniref:Uncharacterized protein n=1 Tax=Peronospora matthiolae TaxID=2874970 RepID=A0AAV1UMX0_9STRA
MEAATAAANTEHDVDDDSKKVKEWWGRPGWGHRWGGYGWRRPGLGTVVAGVDTVAAGDGCGRHTSTNTHRHACNLPHSHTDGTEQKARLRKCTGPIKWKSACSFSLGFSQRLLVSSSNVCSEVATLVQAYRIH